MKKKLPKMDFKFKVKPGEKIFFGILLLILLAGIWCGRTASERYLKWTRGRDYRTVMSIFEAEEELINKVFGVYNGHADLGGENLEEILVAVDEGISAVDNLKSTGKVKEEEIKRLLERDLEASREVLIELKKLVEYLLKIQPFYRRFEASAVDFLGKDFQMVLKMDNFIEEKLRIARIDFEMGRQIKEDDFDLAQENFLVILGDYVELLEKGETAVKTKSRFLYLRSIDEYKERIKKAIDDFNQSIELEKIESLDEKRVEKNKLDEELITRLKNER